MGRHLKSRSVPILSVFRKGDPDSITVLQLLAATNDLGTLMRMILHKQGTKSENNATYRYAMRMGALHIDSIKRLAKRELPRLVERHFWRKKWAEDRERARKLQELLEDERIAHVIGIARNKFAGHYDREFFEKALSLLDRGDLMELPGVGIHHNVGDILFDQVLARESHIAYKKSEIEDSLQQALNGFMDIQKALLPVVNALVVALYFDAEGWGDE
jgi:hypothetical protein